MLGFFFSEHAVSGWEDAKGADTSRFAAFHGSMLERGVYLPPSQFEAWFLSSEHGEVEVETTLAAVRTAFAGPA
jgi:glutamate-1-semialdehyde 2,1-aminomutase